MVVLQSEIEDHDVSGLGVVASLHAERLMDCLVRSRDAWFSCMCCDNCTGLISLLLVKVRDLISPLIIVVQKLVKTSR